MTNTGIDMMFDILFKDAGKINSRETSLVVSDIRSILILLYSEIESIKRHSEQPKPCKPSRLQLTPYELGQLKYAVGQYRHANPFSSYFNMRGNEIATMLEKLVDRFDDDLVD